MKIAICDDEAAEREKLSACIREYLDREMIAAEIDFPLRDGKRVRALYREYVFSKEVEERN